MKDSTQNGNGTSGLHAHAKPFPPGIHVPSLTFFKKDARQEIDWELQERHLEFLISSGLHGIVLAGTNGEAAALTTTEKIELVRLTKKLTQKLGRPSVPVVLGCGGGCTRAVIEETAEAGKAGADYALVLIPSFFHFAMDSSAIIDFFQKLADESPIPILIYNFPGVVAGLDVNSEMLEVLGQHPNIVGVKLTCGGIGKVTRISARFDPNEFSALAGQSDWLIPALSIGGTGCITGVGNLYPKTCLEIYNLYTAGKLKEAGELQKQLGIMEWGFGKGGINGTKWVVSKKLGYPETSADCRQPYPTYTDECKRDWILKQVQVLDPIEKGLSKMAN
ncbi:hypothetical protein FQN54_003859 [Arachnomyces sp. PD_36]|nr:hypothetical protein FQN54_003859 [Arachnomyces sp. PD_36]